MQALDWAEKALLAEKQGDTTSDWFQPSLPLKENFHQIFFALLTRK